MEEKSRHGQEEPTIRESSQTTATAAKTYPVEMEVVTENEKDYYRKEN